MSKTSSPHERFIIILDLKIALWRKLEHDPKNIRTAVLNSLLEIRTAYAEAFDAEPGVEAEGGVGDGDKNK